MNKLEPALAKILQLGILLSCTVIIVGGFLLERENPSFATLKEFNPNPSYSFLESLVLVGVVLLILTPICRVAACLIFFIIKKDTIYTLICSTLLTIILSSFFW